jgi:ABC transport system ATP-binding/permease protein
MAKKQNFTKSDEDRLDDLKETLALLSGLAGKDAGEVTRKLHEIDKIINGAALDRSKFDTGSEQLTAEQLFQNRKITDMLTDAQMKQKDYAVQTRNVFFGPEKSYFGQKFDIFLFNSFVINGFTLLFLLWLLTSLVRQLRTG